MIVLFIVLVMSILGIGIVSKKVANKPLRYIIITALMVIAVISLWIMIVALKSGEM